MYLFLCFLYAFIHLPVSEQIIPDAMSYLEKYGYLEKTPQNLFRVASVKSTEELKNAVKEFQRFAGLKATGEIDDRTVFKMSLPRCGVKDIHYNQRYRRFVVQGSRWRNKNLLYKVTKYSNKLHTHAVDYEIKRAFEVWSNYIPITFTETAGNPHLDIRFETGNHGDEAPFEGPEGDLAHAFFPVFGGAIHFDDNEKWSSDSTGKNLYQIATHEIGHVLGLDHSRDENALMSPFYQYRENFGLQQDDISGIQAIYGRREENEIQRANDICSTGTFDAILKSPLGNTMIFKGDLLWILTDEGSIASGYPRKISEMFVGLPNKIDAGLTIQKSMTYFFKGSQVWLFKGRLMYSGYPKEIREVFPGIPNGIDAATIWGGNNKIYFFKGTEFWQFDPKKNESGIAYPKNIAMWRGVPGNLNGALLHKNGDTYFFKDNLYYLIDDKTLSVVNGYPRPINSWIKC